MEEPFFLGEIMRPKECGYVLSIDQASNVAGVSLWKDGELAAVSTLVANPKDKMSRRLDTQRQLLTDFLDKSLPDNEQVKIILFEGVRARLVLITVGAFLACPRLDLAVHPKASFVESRSWKNWARKHGATDPIGEIKGVKALRETGFDVDKYGIESDDIADSILIYLSWRDRN